MRSVLCLLFLAAPVAAKPPPYPVPPPMPTFGADPCRACQARICTPDVCKAGDCEIGDCAVPKGALLLRFTCEDTYGRMHEAYATDAADVVRRVNAKLADEYGRPSSMPRRQTYAPQYAAPQSCGPSG